MPRHLSSRATLFSVALNKHLDQSTEISPFTSLRGSHLKILERILQFPDNVIQNLHSAAEFDNQKAVAVPQVSIGYRYREGNDLGAQVQSKDFGTQRES